MSGVIEDLHRMVAALEDQAATTRRAHHRRTDLIEEAVSRGFDPDALSLVLTLRRAETRAGRPLLETVLQYHRALRVQT